MKAWLKRALLAVLFALLLAFFALDFQQYLTFEHLQASQAQFSAWWQQHPLLVPGLFLVVYTAVTGLSLPGAAVMTMAAGALFGLWLGTLLVSFASAIGATCAFLIARFTLRETVQARFGHRLATINRGVERDGAFYLFSLRLVPLFPFFLINLLMALTAIPTRTFYWVSQAGMLPGTLVFVYAGTQLANLDSPSGILSPSLWSAFVLLGVFPWLARGLVRLLRRGRVYRGWQRPKRYDYNLIVIGAGAAGLVSAYIATTVKAKVALIEANKMGGDCLNYGCVPSKALIRSARLAHEMRNADRHGLAPATSAVDFPAVIRRVRAAIAAISPHDSAERYRAMGVAVYEGQAQLVDPWTVEVRGADGSTQRLCSRSIVIAAGSRPVVPPLPGLDDVGYVTSDTLWERLDTLERAPGRLLVLGGGNIGCELAQAFARLGAAVTLVEKSPQLLGREDSAVSERVRDALQADGVRVLAGCTAKACERRGGQKCLVVDSDEGEQRLVFDELLCALGRKPHLSGYGLQALGINTEMDLVTNDYLETLYPNIFAAGDVAGIWQFTHTAAHTAWYAAVNALFGQFRRFKLDRSVIPRVIFTDPEVARVGLNRREADAQDVAYEISRYELADLDRAITDGVAEGYVQVLTVPGRDRILGVTIVGAQAGELLAEFVLAMKHKIGLNKILGTLHSYPTLAEANKYAAGVWRQAHTPERFLALAGHYHRWRRR